jgi:DNA-binding FadR family transcriptional regulator
LAGSVAVVTPTVSLTAKVFNKPQTYQHRKPYKHLTRKNTVYLFSSDDKMSPNTIQRRSLADEVAYKLQGKILKGAYKVNEKLPVEADLMRSFGVGRSTIREAVKILVNSGFLRVQQGIGTFIEDTTGINEPLTQRLKRAGARDIDEVRQILEMKIAEKAAMNRTGNDISKLEHFLAKRNKAAEENQVPECIDAHINFYIVLAEASKNEILADLYKLFAIRLKADLLDISDDTALFKEHSDHLTKLFDGVLREDPKKAWTWSGKITGQHGS